MSDKHKSLTRVDGKVALVTGAAKGLGEAIAQVLHAHGAKLLLTDVDTAGGEAVAARINADGGQALFLRHDVTAEEQWIAAVARAHAHFGGLHILVNNAGLGKAASAEDETLEQWRLVMSVNLDGVFLGTKHGIRGMKQSGGSIVNISSIEGIIAEPSLAAYNASKAGVRNLTKSAALHCARSRYGIRVNSVHPGYIWTPMVENHLRIVGDVAAGRREIDKLHPIGHMGEPIDVAYGVLYLASEASKFVTGAELVIDGGYTAQ
ncbi:MAG: glucose 1-dehydrogenase [Nevskia sp.]|nr:glucose 1-dehydrogenase [Nevskia sp.]